MLCYQGLGDTAGAGRQQVMYKRFKADEAAQFITGPYRQLHPHDNNERQPIHEHRSVVRAAARYTGAGGQAPDDRTRSGARTTGGPTP